MGTIMRTSSGAISLGIAPLLFAASVLAIPMPDDLAGPPSYTIHGCPANETLTPEVVSHATGISIEHIELTMQRRYLSLTDFCVMPRAKRDRAIARSITPKPDSPGEWAKQRAQEQADENGVVKPDGLLVAMQKRNGMVSAPSEFVAGIRSSGWTALGPGNIGGRIRAISPNPSDANDIVIGSVSGGIWRTTDGGANWAPVNDFLINLAVSTIARAPSNPSVLYAGTGEGFFNSDAVQGLGIFKSTDSGATWTHLASTLPPANPAASHTSDFYFVNRIAVHPANPNIVVAATRGYYSNWGGLWRSTDGGATWTKVYARRLGDVKFDPDPASPNRVLLGEIYHQYFDGVAYVNAGGGVATVADIAAAVALPVDPVSDGSFTRTVLNPAGKDRVEISFAPATVGLAVSVVNVNSGEFYLSTDHGVTWALNSTPGHLGSQGWYDNALWVDPANSTRIVVGGIDLWRGTAAASWWTTNSLITWSKISNWQYGGSYGPSAHADHHGIIQATGYDGVTNRTVYFGNDGGMYKGDIASVNGDNLGSGWTKLNNGLAVTQFYGGAGKNYGASTVIVGGTQDNGSLKAPSSGLSWSTFFGGDGGWSAVDPADPNYYYGEYVYASVHRASTGGNSSIICNGTANNVNNIKEGYAGYCGTTATSAANFISPFVLDPNNATAMLVGAKSLWRSTDLKAAAPSWVVAKAPTVAASNYISAIAVAPGNSDIVWVGHNNGEVYCTINGTSATPAWVSQPGTPARRVLRIMIDQSNNNRVFVATGGYSSPNVHETTNGCPQVTPFATWTARHNNLPAAPVRSIVRHPANANWLYVGTEVGVFASIDGGLNWSTTNDGPGSVSTDELFWLDSSTLVAATHGRGMFKATISPGTIQFAQPTLSVPEAGGAATISVTRTGGSGGAVGVSFSTANGTGIAGVNYTATSGTLIWPDGDTSSQSITVPILNDNVAAGSKTFTITVSAPTGGATLGTPATLTVAIQDASVSVPAVTLAHDFDGDGNADILWQHADGSAGIWLMNGTIRIFAAGLIGAGSGWSVKQVADFDGDGKADLLWQHTDGSVGMWLMNGTTKSFAAGLRGAGSGWSVRQVADFNGDGKADLIWQHTDGSVEMWLMNGTAMSSSASLIGPGSGWSVTQVADFNGDGKADLIWQHTDGSAGMWLMNGTTKSFAAGLIGPASGWSNTQVADFNGDGKADLIWQHTDGSAGMWLMNGTTKSFAAGLIGAGSGWSVKQVADFNGDGKSDLLWQHTDGSAGMWLMNGTTRTFAAGLRGAGSGWSARQVADFGGDGKSDLVWRHTDGSVEMWLLNGATTSSSASLIGAGTGWSPSP
jgi:hypothetical protein